MKNTILVLALLFSISSLAQNPSDKLVSKFQYSIGGSFNERLHRAEEFDDNIILIMSSSSSDGHIEGQHGSSSTYDIIIASLSKVNGDTLWISRALGGSQTEALLGDLRVIQTTDGNYVFTATVNSNDGDVFDKFSGSGGDRDIWVFKLDQATGDPIWFSEAFGGSRDEYFPEMIEDGNGNIIIRSTTFSDDGDITGKFTSGAGDRDIWIIKVDGTNGTTIWESEALGGSGIEWITGILLGNDGNLICYGSTSSDNDGDVTGGHGGSQDMWIIKLDAGNGNKIWDIPIGGTGIEFARDAHLTSDGNIIIFGNTNSSDGDILSNHGAKDAIVAKVNTTNGSLIWVSRGYGGSNNDDPIKVHPLGSDKFLMLCHTQSFDGDIKQKFSTNIGAQDIWFVEFDATTQDTSWTSRAYGGSLGAFVKDIYPYNSELYVVATSSSNDGDLIGKEGPDNKNDWWVLKINTLTHDISFSEALGGDFQEEYYYSTLDCYGGLLISGDTYSMSPIGEVTQSSPPGVFESLWMIQLDRDLNVRWDKVWSDSSTGSNHVEHGWGFPLDDGGVVLIGSTGSDAAAANKVVTSHGATTNVRDVWVTKLIWDVDYSITTNFDSLSNDDTLCTGTIINFNYNVDADIADEYIWSFGNGDSSLELTPNYTLSDSGEYNITLVLRKNCAPLDTAFYSILAKGLELDLGSDTMLCSNETLVLDAQNHNAQHLWNTGETSPSIIVSDTGIYFVTSIDPISGCDVSDSLTISPCDDSNNMTNNLIFIPNSFRPESNNVNESFRVLGLSSNDNVLMSIYDRHGKLLFAEAGTEIFWDGSFRESQKLNAGNYIYAITINNTEFYTGNITLIR